MKKQKGFTLIELMVVMAIIAILATAGLSAYTGYIKKARDTTRIADLAAIETIVQGALTVNGLYPAIGDIVTTIESANNGQLISDPLAQSGVPAEVCQGYQGGTGTYTSTGECSYTYYQCDEGAGYMITAYLESPSNLYLYEENKAGYSDEIDGKEYYDIGSCTESSGGFTF